MDVGHSMAFVMVANMEVFRKPNITADRLNTPKSKSSTLLSWTSIADSRTNWRSADLDAENAKGWGEAGHIHRVRTLAACA